ncbi:hypothetical protein BDA96_06G008500 [Sorghum bicolor]|uniref:Legume lectin domain-containing protein n=1 Tax=Sorghum bicolor TaxID=4558 RepID=A0A921QMS0_SORBI|nr:hypothetical protein BDA96_06G008500 [Sorghum bicolor]
MPSSDRMTGAIKLRLVLLLVVVGAAAISVAAAAAADVDSFSYPVFDATTTQDLVAGSNTSILTPASLLFNQDALFAEFNRTEGFLLLSRTVDVWRVGTGGAPAFEASFNTSFALSGGAPVAFVVLRDSYPTLYGTGGLRGFANYSASDADDGATSRNASGSLVSVEAGPVRSYGPDSPAVGLNVTVTPNDARVAVWIEYDAGVHRLSVYVAGAGDARPATALLDPPLGLAGERTTEKAMVGFFAGAVQDILVGVRDWNLTVDRFFDSSGGGDGWKKGTSSWVILLAVLGSVAAMA